MKRKSVDGGDGSAVPNDGDDVQAKLHTPSSAAAALAASDDCGDGSDVPNDGVQAKVHTPSSAAAALAAAASVFPLQPRGDGTASAASLLALAVSSAPNPTSLLDDDDDVIDGSSDQEIDATAEPDPHNTINKEGEGTLAAKKTFKTTVTFTMCKTTRSFEIGGKRHTIDDLKPLFLRPFTEAAEILGVSRGRMSRACRTCQLYRWPYRKLWGMRQSIKSLERHISESTNDEEKATLQLQIDDLLRRQKEIVNAPEKTCTPSIPAKKKQKRDRNNEIRLSPAVTLNHPHASSNRKQCAPRYILLTCVVWGGSMWRSEPPCRDSTLCNLPCLLTLFPSIPLPLLFGFKKSAHSRRCYEVLRLQQKSPRKATAAKPLSGICPSSRTH
jgi:hypothetical protein